MNRALVAGGVVVAAGVAILIVKFTTKDYPIEVGDGSIKLHYKGTVVKNSANELEPHDKARKVKKITIGDDNGGGPLLNPVTIDVNGRKWSMTSNSTPGFQLSLRSHGSSEDGVPATCPTSWSGSGPDYTCGAAGGTRLTPVTLTFTDGNCPGTASSSCQLACSSNYCRLQLEYKK